MSHNPYTPPIAPIRDSEPATPPPWQVKTAVWLIWISLGISVVFYLVLPEDSDLSALGDSVLLTVALVSLGLAIVVMGLLSFFILRAHRWARIVYSALVVLGLISTIRGVTEEMPDSWIVGVVMLLSIAVDLTSVVLLYTPPANTFFAKRRAAAQA